MRKHSNDYFSMGSIKGTVRMCCSTTTEFRDRVALAARQRGIKSQDFVLEAVRDKMRQHTTRTVEERRAIALRALFESRQMPDSVKRALDELLAPHMPDPVLIRRK